MSIPADNPKIVFGPLSMGTVTGTPGSVTSGGMNDGTYYYWVAPFVMVGAVEYPANYAARSVTTTAGAGKGKVTLSWTEIEGADGYHVWQMDSGTPSSADLVATYQNGAWDAGTGTASTWTTQTDATPITGALPTVTGSPVTLWLPKKFVNNWEPKATRSPDITKGFVYTQVLSYPLLYEVKNKTAIWDDTASEDYMGSGAENFTVSWKRFWEGYGSLGKVFQFYRKATDSTAGWSYFSRCVLTQTDNGLTQYKGRPRYDLEIAFRTEGAAR